MIKGKHHTICLNTQYNDSQHNDTKYNNKKMRKSA